MKTCAQLLIVLAALACTAAVGAGAVRAAEPDLNLIARQAVEVLDLQPGENVVIHTWRHTLEFAEMLAREVYRAGALPLIVMDSDSLYAFRLAEVPEETLRLTSKLALGLVRNLDAEIVLAGPGDPAVFAAGSPAKLAAISEADRPLTELWKERQARGMYINHGFATPQRAAQYGVDYEQWRDSVLAAIGADLDAVSEQAERLRVLLEDAEEVVVTTPQGTDLVFSTQGREARFWKAAITPEMVAEGEGWAMLPSGSVACTIVETSADGTVVAPQVALWGKVVRNLLWQFESGRLVRYSADVNLEPFAEYLEGASGDKDRIASITIGVNPEGEPTGLGLEDWMYSGVVSIGIGRNLDDGGENDTDFGWSVSLTGTTVVIDGTVAVQDGEIVI